MKLTVIREDNMVIVDNVSHSIDCSELPTFVHAIQFDNGVGHIEFNVDGNGRKMGNVKITDITFANYLVDRHKIEDERVKKEKKEAEEKLKRATEEREAKLKELMNKKIDPNEPA
jgi:sRNA-binding protein